MLPSLKDFPQDALETLQQYMSDPIPWSIAPRSGLHVTEEMKEILAQPGFLKTKKGGDRLRKLYINQSIGFNPEHLSPFGRYCYYGVLKKVVQEFERELAPALSTTETEYNASYATIVVWGSQRVTGLGFDPGHHEVLRFLISRGLPLNMPDICGLTPLHHFMNNDRVESRNTPMLRTLLEGGANPNLQDRYGIVPLFNACDKKYLEAVELLMDFGADLTIKDADGCSPMMCSTAMGPQVSAVIQKCLRRQKGEEALPRTEKRCDGCHATDKPLKNCGRCQIARYCSVDCQKKDWSTHKKKCQAFARADTVTVKPFYESEGSFRSASETTRKLLGNKSKLGLPEFISAINSTKATKLKPVDPKNMVVKVQIPVDTYSRLHPQPEGDILIYTKKKDFACLIRRSDDSKAWDTLQQAVKTKGATGLKAYFSATLISKEELIIKISEALATQPF